jgi:GNAT superfamily N-acetyltransferase
MGMEIRPLAAEHLEDAARLLAARHRRDRARAPVLAATFEQPAAAAACLEDLLRTPHAAGAVAIDGGRLTGFMLGARLVPTPASFQAALYWPRSAVVRYSGWAVDPDAGPETPAALYAALAPAWVAAGCYSHYIFVPAADPAARDAWFPLGFGAMAAEGVRPHLDPPPRPAAPPALEIRAATPADAADVLRMLDDLSRFHARAPMYTANPVESAEAATAGLAAQLAGPDSGLAFWVARVGKEPAGVYTVRRPPLTPSAVKMDAVPDCAYIDLAYIEPAWQGRGVGGGLLDHVLREARAAGHARLFVGWETANPLSSRFWPRQGFAPLTLRLARHIDPRIAYSLA